MNEILDEIRRDMRRESWGSGLDDSLVPSYADMLGSLKARPEERERVRRQYLRARRMGGLGVR
ncbi:MAG: hypothetical protein U1E22_06945 [Coriobacteriia bacterium]|nr:hypothetical protein [Coriobacteriia bacterium]